VKDIVVDRDHYRPPVPMLTAKSRGRNRANRKQAAQRSDNAGPKIVQVRVAGDPPGAGWRGEVLVGLICIPNPSDPRLRRRWKIMDARKVADSVFLHRPLYGIIVTSPGPAKWGRPY